MVVGAQTFSPQQFLSATSGTAHSHSHSVFTKFPAMWTRGTGGSSEMFPVPYRTKRLHTDLQSLKAKLVHTALRSPTGAAVWCVHLAHPVLQPERVLSVHNGCTENNCFPLSPCPYPHPFLYLQVNLKTGKMTRVSTVISRTNPEIPS